VELNISLITWRKLIVDLRASTERTVSAEGWGTIKLAISNRNQVL